MKLPSVRTACPLCGSSKDSDFSILYSANLAENSLKTEVFSARRLPDKIHYQLVKCNNDGLVRSTPTFPSSIATTLYRKSKMNYQDEVNNLIESYVLNLEPILNKLNKDAKILEIGCGSGFLLSALYKKGYVNTKGIEPSLAAAKMADPFIKDAIITEPFTKKLLNEQRFDLICMFQTLDHLPDITQTMEDCYDCLQPGGYFFSLHHDVEYPLRRMLGENHPIIDIEHLQLFSQKTSVFLFEKHGFLTESVVSPQSVLSISHLVWLLPVPTVVKKAAARIAKSLPWLNATINLKLGNVAILGRKPSSVSNS